MGGLGFNLMMGMVRFLFCLYFFPLVKLFPFGLVALLCRSYFVVGPTSQVV